MTNKKSAHNNWFEEHKDIFVRNAIRNFLKTLKFFEQLYKTYNESKEISFKNMDYWIGTEMRKGPLWQFKDLCHAVWGNEEQMDVDCALLDWLVGSIFHEGMKLKENIYLLQHYKPAYERMAGQSTKLIENQNLDDYLELFRKITEEINLAVPRLNRLFLRAAEQLHKVLLKCRDNHLVLRLLIENEPEFDRIWGVNSIPRFFEEMFSGQKEKGYCLAAESYQEGNWMEKALDTYQKALDINPDSEEARQGMQVIKAIMKNTP
ncbi:MAG: hypothetical protein AB1487_08160 [Thermodesulfobacteriota bacterium]